jgi:hypothetical protein
MKLSDSAQAKNSSQRIEQISNPRIRSEKVGIRESSAAKAQSNRLSNR